MSTLNAISPPSADKTNLAIADLVIYVFLLFPALWIARNHGKAGLVCWLILLPYFPLRIVSDAYQIANRDKPELPNTVAIMTNAGSISCLSLALIGVVYEVNMWLPLPPKQLTEKILLGIMHLAVTVGIILATYGGAPEPKSSGGVVAEALNRAGNCLMLFAMLFGLGGWIWWTGKHVITLKPSASFQPAKSLLLAACVALPFQLVRLGHSLTYSFTPYPMLDPISGTFVTKLILMFGMQLCAVIAILVGGWSSIREMQMPASELSSLRQGVSGV